MTIDTAPRVLQYLKARRDRLELLEKMWNDPRVYCYNDQFMPTQNEEFGQECSVFLAGPTSRHQILEYNWRCEAVAYLREAGWKWHIFVPEPRGLEQASDFPDSTYIHWWESYRLLKATHPVFWIPRNSHELLGLNTNFEQGYMVREVLARGPHANLFIGSPKDAERMGLPRHYTFGRTWLKEYDTLRRLCYGVLGTVPPEDMLDTNESTN